MFNAQTLFVFWQPKVRAGWTPEIAEIQFNIRDLWLGIFFDRKYNHHIYICIVPCFPIRICWWAGVS